tara:strand:+ start:42 stop:521 length:480 start_codon:yes stop_codon:yes gene_type:complete
MTKSTTPVAVVAAAFTRKNAAALYLAAPVKGREAVAERIKAQAAKNQKRAWKTLVRYIATADLVRIKLVVSGTREEWAAINADAKAASKVAKVAPKPKAAKNADAKAAVKCAVQHRNGKVSDGVDAVAAAKAYAVLVASGMAGSPEAAMLTAYFTRMHG